MTNYKKLINHWEMAASDLGLDLVVPYCLVLDSGIELNALFLVKDFGSPKGMLIFSHYEQIESCSDYVLSAGYGFAVLDMPSESEVYDRDEFIEVLLDWGWSGEDKKRPDWV